MSNIPFFLSSDNNYAPFVATTIASILSNTKCYVDFYVLDSGITNENKEKICELKNRFANFSIEFIKVELDKEFAEIEYKNQGKWISLSTYNRLLISKLKPEIEKFIYTDVDVVALGDITEIYNCDLDGYILGAVWEETVENTENVKRKLQLKLCQDHKYFNAGVLLIDNKQWISKNITQILFEIEKSLRNILTAADQDLLNKIFDNKYKVLDKRYNWINQNQGVLSAENIVFRHFNGKIKPWNINPDVKISTLHNKNDFWKYAKMTEFYNELVEKTLNENEQKMLLRQLQIVGMINKSRKSNGDTKLLASKTK